MLFIRLFVCLFIFRSGVNDKQPNHWQLFHLYRQFYRYRAMTCCSSAKTAATANLFYYKKLRKQNFKEKYLKVSKIFFAKNH